MQRHQMKHPRHFFIHRARAASAQDGTLGGDDFGLHEQIAERRMGGVRCGWRQHYFGVAGDVYGTARARAIDDTGTAQFDIIFLGHHDFGMHVEIAVAPPEFGAALGEDHFVAIRLCQCGLECRRPEMTRFACVEFTYITEGTPVIARAVFLPAGDGKIVPATAAAAGAGDHHVIMSVG